MNSSRVYFSRGWLVGATMVIALTIPLSATAQQRIGLQDAIDAAIRARPELKADAERVAAAQGSRQQAAARANGELQFSNENLRKEQTYGRDVDTFAILSQPLDLAGRRSARIALADQQVSAAQANAESSHLELIRAVVTAYWEAREAQEASDVLEATVNAFQQVVDYHRAQLQVGMIAEQDVLRIQLESERLQVSAGLAALDATRTRAALLRAIGRPVNDAVVLSEPIDRMVSPPPPLSDDAVLAAHVEMKAAAAAVGRANANVHLQAVFGRPEWSAIVGYKRTQLPDAVNGVNTLVAGFKVTLPWGDRNTGNQVAASADLRREQNLLDAARLRVLSEYHAALEDYQLRRDQITRVVIPLRQHAANIADLAQAAYTQGGADLLRLLDAKRAQLDADLAWVHAMTDWQQSAATLQFAGGQIK